MHIENRKAPMKAVLSPRLLDRHVSGGLPGKGIQHIAAEGVEECEGALILGLPRMLTSVRR